MHLPLEPLTPEAFAPFGTVIANPRKHPSTLRPPPEGISANQGTATKYSPIAPLSDMYQDSSQGRQGEARFSLFICHPRSPDQNNTVTQAVLERHPFTTQAFIPMGLGPTDTNRTAFVVIVAPPSTNGPNIHRARAFLAPGNMAVNYGVGTWHAPMIVVGERPVEFVVVQFVDGVPKDDCVEWQLSGEEVLSIDISEAVKSGAGRREKL